MRSRSSLVRAGLCVVLVVAVGACRRSERAPEDAGTNDAAIEGGVRAGATIDAGATSIPSASASATSAAASVDGVAPAFYDAKLLSAHPIGHTSVVLKIKLEGGLVAAWKPDSRRGKDRYRGEVAARRLARALAIENVPPVGLRAFPRDELLRACDADARALVEKEGIADAKGDVPGALVPWIAGLTFPPLESEPKKSRWQKVLAGTAPVGDEGVVYFADISTLVVFDALSGNWDRWSGGNVGFVPLDKGARRDAHLLFVDNDAAFLAHPPPDALARNRKLLRATKRFSHSFVAAVRALDPARLEAIFGQDLAHAPLLSAAAVEGVRGRLGNVVEAFDAAGPDGTNALP